MASELDINVKVQSYTVQFLVEQKGEQLQNKLKILQEALNMQLCNYCIIRFLQWENQRLMNEPVNVLKQIWQELLKNTPCLLQLENPEKVKCEACQGLCEYVSDLQFKEELLQTIKNSGYQYYEYYLALTVPEYFLLLDAIVFYKLKRKGCYQGNTEETANPAEYRPTHSINRGYKISSALKKEGELVFTQQLDQVIPLKQLIKFILGFYLTPRLGVPVSHTSSFKCLVKFFNNLQLNMEVIEGKKVQNDNLNNKKTRKQHFDERKRKQVQNDGIAPLIKNYINKMYADNLFDHVPEALDQNEAQISHQFIPERDDVYLGGRYLKLQRGVAQTGEVQQHQIMDGFVTSNQNNCNNQELSQESDVQNKGFLLISVESMLREAFEEVLDFEGFTLIAGGREDMDVRMLGSGRPFLIEFKKLKCIQNDWNDEILPKINQILTRNKYVSINVKSGLKFYEKNIEKTMKLLYNAAIEKKKIYKAVIYSQEKYDEKSLRDKIESIFDEGSPNITTIEQLKALCVNQNTPIRVLHRRTLLTRKKYIFQIELDKVINPNVFTINITSSAGTYIKEFVHGDFGRTVPSLSTLLNMKVQIIQLDVREVDVPWPI